MAVAYGAQIPNRCLVAALFPLSLLTSPPELLSASTSFALAVDVHVFMLLAAFRVGDDLWPASGSSDNGEGPGELPADAGPAGKSGSCPAIGTRTTVIQRWAFWVIYVFYIV